MAAIKLGEKAINEQREREREGELAMLGRRCSCYVTAE